MAATLKFHYSGGASNSDADASLGGTHSSAELSSTARNNVFDDVSADEASAGSVDYRAIDITNTGDAEATSIKFYVNPETSSGDSKIDAGIESSPVGSTLFIADEDTAPSGVSFAHYNSSSKLSLPDIAAGSYCRVWLRRTISASATNTSNDSASFNVEYA